MHALDIASGHLKDREYSHVAYPPIAERLTVMMSGYHLPSGSPFWPFTACLLIALIRQENRPLDVVAHLNLEMVESLLDRLW